MYGLFSSTYNWAKSKYDSLPSRETISTAIKKTVSQTAELGYTLYNSIDSEAVIQRWEGFTQIAHPSHLSFYFRKPKVRTVLNRAILANLVYMLPLLSYEMFKHYYYKIYYPDYVEDPNDSSYSAYTAYLAAWAINTGVDVLFAPWWVNMSADNVFHNGNVTTIVSDENPDPMHKRTCGDEQADIIFANIASVVHYAVDMTALWVLEKLIPFGLGKYVVFPLRIRINGRALTEVNLSKMCTKHRNEELAKNTGFSDGIGAAYEFTTDVIYWGLGVKHKFIYDPLSYLVFQIFATAALLINKPLPGKKEELDSLYYIHTGMSMMFNQISKGILAYLNSDSGGCDFVLVPLTLEQFIPDILVEGQNVSEKDLIKDMSEQILKNIDTLAGKSNSAYVLTNDQYLFYLDKKKKTCAYIEVSNEKHGELRNKLLNNVSLEAKETSKCLIDKLSIEQLQLITTITEHVRQLDWNKLVKKIADFPPVSLATHYLIDDVYLAIFEGYRFRLLSPEIEKGEEKLELGKLYLKPEATGFSYMVNGMAKPESIKKEGYPSLKSKDTSTFVALELLKDEISQIVAERGHPPIEAAIKLPPIKLFLDLNGPGWRSTIEEIKKTKEKWWPYLAQSVLNQYTPSAYENTRALLQIVLNENLGPALQQVEQLLNIHGKYHRELKNKVSAGIITARTVKKGKEIKVNPASPFKLLDNYNSKEEVAKMIKEMVDLMVDQAAIQGMENNKRKKIEEMVQKLPQKTLQGNMFVMLDDYDDEKQQVKLNQSSVKSPSKIQVPKQDSVNQPVKVQEVKEDSAKSLPKNLGPEHGSVNSSSKEKEEDALNETNFIVIPDVSSSKTNELKKGNTHSPSKTKEGETSTNVIVIPPMASSGYRQNNVFNSSEKKQIELQKKEQSTAKPSQTVERRQVLLQ